ncbi:MAG: MFS transporter [Chloroflexota bacterium]
MSATTAPAGSTGIRDLARLPDFRRVWSAQAISDVGDALTNLALLLVVNHLTGSTAAIAAMALVLALPQLLFGVAAGALVDRWDRRRIMLASDLLRAGLVLGFVLVGSADRLWLLLLLGFLQATVGAFFTPARMALMPHVVPEDGLLAANSLTQMTRLIAGVLGAAAAGLLASTVGELWPAFVADALTFLVSFLLILGVRRGAGEVTPAADTPRERQSVLAESLEGVRIVLRSRVLSATLFAVAVVMLGLGAVNVLFVPLVLDVVAVPPAWLGIVELAQAIGMIVSALLIAAVFRRAAPTRILSVGMVAVGVVIALLGMSSAVWQLLLLMFLVGWSVAPVQAAVTTIVQTSTTDAVRGRVGAILSTVTAATTVLSMAIAGIAGDALGVPAVFLGAGALAVVAGVGAAVLYRRGPARTPSTGDAQIVAAA